MGLCCCKEDDKQPDINVKVHDVICCQDIASTCCIKAPKKHHHKHHHHHKHKEVETPNIL